MASRRYPPATGMILKTKDQFTAEQIRELIEAIKDFDAGAVDAYLTDHVEAAFSEWLETQKEE